MWIKGYPTEEGLCWVTLNWGKVSSVELARVRKISNGVLVDSMGVILFEDDVAAYWSEYVTPPTMYKA